MPHEDPEFCGRCKSQLNLDADNCPNCGAWLEAVRE